MMEYEYGVHQKDSIGPILCAVRSTHRAAVDYITEQTDSDTYVIARRTVPSYQWNFDWAED